MSLPHSLEALLRIDSLIYFLLFISIILIFMLKNNEKNLIFVGVVLAAMVIFFWGITFVCTKYLLVSFSAYEVLVIRFLLAYFCLWILYPHKYPVKEKKHNIYFACAGFFGVTLYQLMENVALHFSSASNVSIIVSITPIFTAIIAQIFLKEKHVSFKFFIGFLLAISGVALVSFNGTAVLHLNPLGDFLALTASVSWGFYSLFVSKINKAGYKSIPATRKVFFYALVFMIPLGFGNSILGDENLNVVLSAAENAARFSDMYNWLCLLFLGLVASGFCFVAWSKACKLVGTVKTTVGIYLIPVVTIIFAFFVLSEPITPMGALGAVLTITGLFVSEMK